MMKRWSVNRQTPGPACHMRRALNALTRRCGRLCADRIIACLPKCLSCLSRTQSAIPPYGDNTESASARGTHREALDEMFVGAPATPGPSDPMFNAVFDRSFRMNGGLHVSFLEPYTLPIIGKTSLDRALVQICGALFLKAPMPRRPLHPKRSF